MSKIKRWLTQSGISISNSISSSNDSICKYNLWHNFPLKILIVEHAAFRLHRSCCFSIIGAQGCRFQLSSGQSGFVFEAQCSLCVFSFQLLQCFIFATRHTTLCVYSLFNCLNVLFLQRDSLSNCCFCNAHTHNWNLCTNFYLQLVKRRLTSSGSW